MKVSAPPQITIPSQPPMPAAPLPVSDPVVVEDPVEPVENPVQTVQEAGRFRRLLGGVRRGFRRFLNWYGRANDRHPYLTGVATASSVYIVGDTVAQCIMPGKPVDLGLPNIATQVGMSLYYGWESPLIFRVIDRAFPLEEKSSNGEDRSEHLVEGAAVMTGQQSEGGLLRRIGQAIARRKQKIIRAAAYRIPIAPFWTMRHVGVLALVHGSSSTAAGLAINSIALWATWLPLLSVEEYVVQNKIPLEYRFLAASAVNLVWQISAALVALF